jgi:hypothetical protein
MVRPRLPWEGVQVIGTLPVYQRRRNSKQNCPCQGTGEERHGKKSTPGGETWQSKSGNVPWNPAAGINGFILSRTKGRGKKIALHAGSQTHFPDFLGVATLSPLV